LPLSSRNFVQLALITPKVLPASAAGSQGYMGDRYRETQFTFSGARYQFNYETIDGANATVYAANAVKSFFSLDSIQEFRILNGLYGRAGPRAGRHRERGDSLRGKSVERKRV
jgi:hypothetical protein